MYISFYACISDIPPRQIDDLSLQLVEFVTDQKFRDLRITLNFKIYLCFRFIPFLTCFRPVLKIIMTADNFITIGKFQIFDDSHQIQFQQRSWRSVKTIIFLKVPSGFRKILDISSSINDYNRKLIKQRSSHRDIQQTIIKFVPKHANFLQSLN